MPLMVDANMRYSVEQAISAARKFRDFDVYWFEEPTIPDDYKGMARIAIRGRPADCGRREPAYRSMSFVTQSKTPMIAFPEPDVSNIGGITNWMRVAKLAYAHNLAGHLAWRA